MGAEFEDAIQDETIDASPPETFMHTIEVDLSADEQLALKDQLVVVDNRMLDIEREKAAEMSGFNERLKTTRKERLTILEAIASGKGRRELACYEEREGETRMLIKRVDTNEVIDERALTLDEREGKAESDERQPDLFDHRAVGAGGGDEDGYNDAPETEADDEGEGGRVVHTTSAEARANAEDRQANGAAQEGDAQA